MPISKIKLETEFCLDAKHAQDELLAAARAIAAEDTRMHYELTGEPDVTVVQSRPEIVCEVMPDEPGMLWRGRLVATLTSGAVRPNEHTSVPVDGLPFEVVQIPGWGQYTIRHDMSAAAQVEMWEEFASDQGASGAIVEAGKQILTDALNRARGRQEYVPHKVQTALGGTRSPV